MKHGLFTSDFHCGHLVGLTPPEYQLKFLQTDGLHTSDNKRNKWYNIAQALWNEFNAILTKLPKLSFLVVNGDLIDGKGKKSGGTELITSSMDEQCRMAIAIINHIREKCGKKGMKVIITYGTDYHTAAEGDDWENIIARDVGADKIGAHEWLEVEGVTFDIKHHIGTSGIPHGRGTAILKEMLWNLIWAEMQMQPRADVVIRAHAHYFMACQDANRLGIVLPALQGMGSKFGARRCSGTVDFGAVSFAVNNGEYTWQKYITRIIEQKAEAYKI